MTNDEANRTIAEAMGKCWHNFATAFDRLPRPLDQCQWCGRDRHTNPNLDFFTPSGFFEAWNWAKEQEWWWQFWYKEFDLSWPTTPAITSFVMAFRYIDPETFPLTLAAWLKESEG